MTEDMAADVALYQRHLRDVATALEQRSQALRIAADLIDVQERPNVAVAVPPVSRALGSIARTREELLDHTLLLAGDAHISQRALADNLGMSHPTLNRRIKKVCAENDTATGEGTQ